MFTLGNIELAIIIIAIIGVVLVLRNQSLTNISKALWVFAILMFNFIALFCFLVWQHYEKKNKKVIEKN